MRDADHGGADRSPTTELAGLAADFDRWRSHLIGVAYRVTGSIADAEDAVQEAWFRLARQAEDGTDDVRDLRAWLTTVVGRIGLDRLRSAAVRRERYVGQWLPEPIITTPGSDDPLTQVVLDDDVRMAAIVVLDRLTPEQRVAFVLHDAFAVPFADIADVLGCSVPAARQHASRGRRAVQDADPPPRVSAAEHGAVVGALAAAVLRGDLDAVVRLLHPDVVMIGDGGGHAPAARRPVTGRHEVAKFLLGLARVYAVDPGAVESVLVNGDPAIVVRTPPRKDGRAAPQGASTFVVRDGTIVAAYSFANPERVRLPDPPAS